MTEPTLYERLGGVFAIAAVVDHFSNAVVQNPIVGQESENPALREWHTNNLGRLPGLKFLRTLWVCNISGGPFEYAATQPGSTPLGLEEALALAGSTVLGGTLLADASPTLVGGAQALAAGGVLSVVSISIIPYAFTEVSRLVAVAVAAGFVGGYLLS